MGGQIARNKHFSSKFEICEDINRIRFCLFPTWYQDWPLSKLKLIVTPYGSWEKHKTTVIHVAYYGDSVRAIFECCKMLCSERVRSLFPVHQYLIVVIDP